MHILDTLVPLVRLLFVVLGGVFGKSIRSPQWCDVAFIRGGEHVPFCGRQWHAKPHNLKPTPWWSDAWHLPANRCTHPLHVLQHRCVSLALIRNFGQEHEVLMRPHNTLDTRLSHKQRIMHGP